MEEIEKLKSLLAARGLADDLEVKAALVAADSRFALLELEATLNRVAADLLCSADQLGRCADGGEF